MCYKGKTMENTILNIAGFNKNSITDGPGFRFVVFAQGCVHGCKGCHNPQTHPFGTGTDYTAAEIIAMIKNIMFLILNFKKYYILFKHIF